MFECPNERYYHYTRDMFAPFEYDMYKKIKDLEKLPKELYYGLRLIKIVYNGSTFVSDSDNLYRAGSVLNMLNMMLKNFDRGCFKNFLKDIPIFFAERDDLHEIIFRKRFEDTILEDYCSTIPKSLWWTPPCDDVTLSIPYAPGCNDNICSKEYYKGVVLSAPIFMFSKETSGLFGSYIENNKPLFIDPYIINTGGTIEGPQKEWSTKIEKALWRGNFGLSSHYFFSIDINKTDLENYANAPKSIRDLLSPRMSLVALSIDRPDYVDARFTGGLRHEGYVSHYTNDTNIAAKIGQIAPYMSKEDHAHYKYIVSVDGWSCSWYRPVWILKSNSLLIKQNSTKVQWFYRELQDGIHYKSFNNTADLINVINWARNNDEEIKNIVEQGVSFVDEHFSLEALYETAYTILNDYYNAINTSITQNTSCNDLNNSYNDLNNSYNDLKNTSIVQNTSYNDLNNSYNTLNHTYSLLLSDYYDAINTSIVQNTSYNDLNNSYNTLNYTYSLLDQSTSYIKKILLPVVGAVSAIAGVSLGAVSVFLIYKYKYMYRQYNSKTLMDDRFSSTEGSIDEITSFIGDNIKDVSPIGISLGRQPIELIALDNSLTYFDFNGKGKFCRTSWIGSKDAFLFYNYDNNISSNHYSKIVLTYWSKLGANSDFEALLEVFDDNQDQEFNSLDSAYKKFGIWQDKNSNGQAEENEFMTLEEAGIINIDFKQMQDIVLDDTIITTADVIWKDNDMTTIAYDLALHYTQ